VGLLVYGVRGRGFGADAPNEIKVQRACGGLAAKLPGPDGSQRLVMKQEKTTNYNV